MRSTLLILIALILARAALPLAVAKPVLTDKAIGDRVQDELQADSAVQAAKVGITVAGGVVTLTGEVDNRLAKERAVKLDGTAETHFEKRRAEEVAWKAGGVVAMINDLLVTREGSDESDH